jgi:hypothetical protein
LKKIHARSLHLATTLLAGFIKAFG